MREEARFADVSGFGAFDDGLKTFQRFADAGFGFGRDSGHGVFF
jgi:hypothetical protein